MPTLVLRSTKGSPLTHSEMDDNFRYVDDVVDGIEANMQSAQDSATASANSATVSAGSAATAAGYADVLAYNFKPTVNPTIDLDFNQQDYSVYEIPDGINKKPLTDIATVTRAGNATYFDATGMMRTVGTDEPRINYNPDTGVCEGLLVEESRTNLVTYSEDFNNASWFDSSTTIVNSSSLTAPDGNFTASKLAKTDGQTGFSYLLKDGGTQPDNTVFTASIFCKKGELNSVKIAVRTKSGTYAGVSFRMDTLEFSAAAAAVINYDYQALGDGWFRVYASVDIGSDPANNNVRAAYYVANNNIIDFIGDGTSGIYVWGAQLEQGSFPTSYIPDATIFNSRASTATYYDSTGTLQTAAVNEARYSYNPANLRAEPSLLLEESRTNLNKGLTNWTLGANTLTSSSVLNPDGSSLNNLLTSNEPVTFKDTVSVLDDTVYTYSVFIKKGTTNWLRIRLQGLAFWINVATMQVGTEYLEGETKLRNVGNGWYRVSKTFTSNSASTFIQIDCVTDNGSANVSGNVYVFGTQLEQGSYPTSYIPTTTTAITRAADSSTGVQATRAADNVVRTLGDEFNPSEFSLYLEASCDFWESQGAVDYLLGLSDGTTNNYLGIKYRGDVPRIEFAQSNESGINTSVTLETPSKLCVSCSSETGVIFTLDGVRFGNPLALTQDIKNVNKLFLGGLTTSSSYKVSAGIKNFKLFPKALSEQECIALTQ